MNDVFLKACRGEKVPYTPVWVMRQAGRYMKEYQDVRAKVDFLTLCKTPELAAKVTLQPIDKLGVDAAILFSDILIPVEAMGMDLAFTEKKGPVLADPIRSRARFKKLAVPDPEDEMPYVMETIRILRKKLNVPLIGFAGAPFTMATYMVEGGSSRNFLNTKKMMYQSPSLFDELMTRITATLVLYLSAQIAAGAQAVQLFDSWGGVLAPDDYRRFALPYVKRAISTLKKEGVPIIYFVNDCAGVIKEARNAGADVIGVDWRIDLSDAIKKVGKRHAIQGNLDPIALFLPPDKLKEKVKDIVEKGKAAKGHIFNLGHGVLPETPVDSVIEMVKAVHTFGKRRGK